MFFVDPTFRPGNKPRFKSWGLRHCPVDMMLFAVCFQNDFPSLMYRAHQ